MRNSLSRGPKVGRVSVSANPKLPPNPLLKPNPVSDRNPNPIPIAN